MDDPDRPLELDAQQAEPIFGWYQLGWVVLDTVTGGLAESAEPATLQLWPEHFDVGTNVALPGGDRVNLGCSPGDHYDSEPYLYVGSSNPARPGDPGYWNVSFGAALGMAEVMASPDPIRRAVQFMRTGLVLLSEAAVAQ